MEAPEYTEGEKTWQESILTIKGVNRWMSSSKNLHGTSSSRSDDGLYECAAHNEGGSYYQSGHITVEFGPTFEEQVCNCLHSKLGHRHQVYDREWSWKQIPVNLSCIATAIPNATVTWWFRNIEISKDCRHQHVCDKVWHFCDKVLLFFLFYGSQT